MAIDRRSGWRASAGEGARRRLSPQQDWAWALAGRTETGDGARGGDAARYGAPHSPARSSASRCGATRPLPRTLARFALARVAPFH